MINYIFQLLNDYTLQVISLGTAILGALCGVLGCFAVLRKQSLLGDAISHASLPGIAIAFLLTGEKNNVVLLIGALLSGIVGVLLMKQVVRKTYLKSDTVLGIVLATFFGFGMLLLTYIQKMPNANQSGLDKYLFGQAATLLWSDVKLLLWILIVVSVMIWFFWKEFKVLLFDEEYAKTLGFKTIWIDLLLMFFIVIAIVLGLQTVGVVLMSALLLAPAAAARQWTNNLGVMVVLAGFLGAFSSVFGTAISTSYNNMPTGPVIVLVITMLAFGSIVFSPKRGVIVKQYHRYKDSLQLQQVYLLCLMKNHAAQQGELLAWYGVDVLLETPKWSLKKMQELEKKSLIEFKEEQWKLTMKGIAKTEEF